MKSKKSGRTPVYDNSLKIAVAREYLTSNLSYKELSVKYDLSTNTIAHFVSWYREHYPGGVILEPPDTVLTGAENEKQLSRQLKEANLKIAGLEMLIEIAQKELGIDIIKKPGTKQSSK